MESLGEFDSIRQALDAPGPTVCEVMLDPAQEFEPRLKSRQLPDGTMVSPALEDMYPFLDRAELNGNLGLVREASALKQNFILDPDGLGLIPTRFMENGVAL